MDVPSDESFIAAVLSTTGTCWFVKTAVAGPDRGTHWEKDSAGSCDASSPPAGATWTATADA